MPGICLAGLELRSLSPNSQIRSLPLIIHEAKTKIMVVCPQPYGYQLRVHASCVCNELVSLHNRHLIDRSYLPFESRLWLTAYRNFIRKERFQIEANRVNPYDVVKNYRGSKRKVYYEAMQTLRTRPLDAFDSLVNMFVKPDRYSADQVYEKAPRAIQYRTPRYNLMMATYLKDVEEKFYQTGHIAKGKSPMARGLMFQEKISKFQNPVYLELDHSKFDSTIRVEHLRTTHKYYSKVLGLKHNGQFHDILEKQIINKGYTKGGIKYMVKGTRMSGDFDTGLGNTIINSIAIDGFMDHCKIPKYEALIDGDDSIVIIEASLRNNLDFSYFSRIGFETKYMVKESEFEVDFCQCRYMSEPQPNFVRSPIRAISHSMVVLREVPFGLWSSGVGMCELSLNQGVPILQQLGVALVRKRFYLDEDMRARMAGVRPSLTPILVTDQARLQFYLNWGILPGDQELIEKSLTGLPINLLTNTRKSSTVNSLNESADYALSSGIQFCSLDTDLSESWGRVSSEHV